MNIGLPGAVFLVFLVLKLTGVTVVAHWSWWAVTSPLWISTILAAAVLGLVAWLDA